jgi:DNA-binding beta-propeller fold protein YncE
VASFVPTTNKSSSIVSAIDGNDYNVSKNLSLPFRVSDIALNPNINRIYLVGDINNYSYLSIIDGQSDTVLKKNISLPFRPSDIAVNPNTNKIYLANNEDRSMTSHK